MNDHFYKFFLVLSRRQSYQYNNQKMSMENKYLDMINNKENNKEQSLNSTECTTDDSYQYFAVTETYFDQKRQQSVQALNAFRKKIASLIQKKKQQQNKKKKKNKIDQVKIRQIEGKSKLQKKQQKREEKQYKKRCFYDDETFREITFQTRHSLEQRYTSTRARIRDPLTQSQQIMMIRALATSLLKRKYIQL